MQQASQMFSPEHASLDALRLGHTARIGIPELILRDHRDRGDDLVEVFAPCPMEGGLLDEFRDARGYAFDWGHVIESETEPSEELHQWTQWHFYIEEPWREAIRLEPLIRRPEYSAFDVAVDIYLAELHTRLPRYLSLLAGLSYDLFALSTLPRGTQDDRRARRWLAERFIPHILPRVTADVLRRLHQAALVEGGHAS